MIRARPALKENKFGVNTYRLPRADDKFGSFTPNDSFKAGMEVLVGSWQGFRQTGSICPLATSREDGSKISLRTFFFLEASPHSRSHFIALDTLAEWDQILQPIRDFKFTSDFSFFFGGISFFFCIYLYISGPLPSPEEINEARVLLSLSTRAAALIAAP